MKTLYSPAESAITASHGFCSVGDRLQVRRELAVVADQNLAGRPLWQRRGRLVHETRNRALDMGVIRHQRIEPDQEAERGGERPPKAVERLQRGIEMPDPIMHLASRLTSHQHGLVGHRAAPWKDRAGRRHGDAVQEPSRTTPSKVSFSRTVRAMATARSFAVAVNADRMRPPAEWRGRRGSASRPWPGSRRAGQRPPACPPSWRPGARRGTRRPVGNRPGPRRSRYTSRGPDAGWWLEPVPEMARIASFGDIWPRRPG